MSSINAQDYFVIIGTYTSGKSEGIYINKLNLKTGILSPVSKIQASNPSFLAVSNDRKFVYAVNENAGPEGGQVSAFAFNSKAGTLKLLNTTPTGGDHPCYVDVNKKRTHVIVGNYSGGNLSVFPVKGDGSLENYSQLIQHFGKGPNTGRQEKAHVHATKFSPDEKYVYVPDLGIDELKKYSFNPAKKQALQLKDSIVAFPGSGPRHFTIHPNKKFIYIIEELTGTVSVYNATSKSLMQRISTHPADYTGTIGSADIHVSPDGKFLYASNRGDANNIAIFSIATNGRLSVKGFQSTRGKTPRNFTIDPTGSYLLVANQNTNNIVVFKRNKKTGLLTEVSQVVIHNPVCLKLVKVG